jgi:uncharacterized protein
MTTLLSLLAYVLMFLGLIGAVLPLLPGAPLIWLGALLWGYADGFRAFGWPTLLLLAGLAALSWVSDLVVTSVTARRAGAGWTGVVAAILGGVAGALIVGTLIPIAGAIVGTLLGASAAMLLVEYRAKREWGLAWKAAGAYIIGYIFSSFVQLAICLTMIGVFVFQALR